MRTTRLAVLATALSLLAATPATAAPGGPDPKFGKGGFVHASFGNIDAGYGIVRTSDGRVVVAGGAQDPRASTGTFFLTRYLADGRVDASFGSRGVARTAFKGGYAIPTELEQLQDGRLLAVGLSLGERTGALALARYTAAGRLDPTFGKGGTVVDPMLGLVAVAADAAVAADGTFVVGGFVITDAYQAKPFVRRYLADGRVDTSFGTNGTVTPTLTGTNAFVNSVVLTPEGSVVAAGSVVGGPAGSMPFLARFLPNGLQDPTFGSGGMTNLPGAAFASVVRTPEGFFLAGGSVLERGADGGDRLAAVVRFLPTGTLDPSFGTAGVTSVKAGPEASVYALGVLSDGRIAAVGYSSGRTRDSLLLRLTATGQRDAAFGKAGVSVQGLPTRDDSAHDLVVGPDGAVTVTGMTVSSNRNSSDTYTARFLP